MVEELLCKINHTTKRTSDINMITKEQFELFEEEIKKIIKTNVDKY
ncbi:MAG: hypothetical protein [Malazfec virus 1]